MAPTNTMVSEDEHNERLIRELVGESRDRHIRPYLVNTAERLILAIHDENTEDIKELCTADVTLVTRLDEPGHIFQGIEEVLSYFTYPPDRRFMALMTIVDRGRIICPVESFIEAVPPGIAGAKYTRQRTALIFDFNQDWKFTRIELRPLSKEQYIDGEMFDDLEDVKLIGVDNSL